jgi:hypothetical protein
LHISFQNLFQHSNCHSSEDLFATYYTARVTSLQEEYLTLRTAVSVLRFRNV